MREYRSPNVMEAVPVVGLDGEVVCIQDADMSGIFECLGDFVVSVLEDLGKCVRIFLEPNF